MRPLCYTFDESIPILLGETMPKAGVYSSDTTRSVRAGDHLLNRFNIVLTSMIQSIMPRHCAAPAEKRAPGMPLHKEAKCFRLGLLRKPRMNST